MVNSGQNPTERDFLSLDPVEAHKSTIFQPILAADPDGATFEAVLRLAAAELLSMDSLDRFLRIQQRALFGKRERQAIKDWVELNAADISADKREQLIALSNTELDGLPFPASISEKMPLEIATNLLWNDGDDKAAFSQAESLRQLVGHTTKLTAEDLVKFCGEAQQQVEGLSDEAKSDLSLIAENIKSGDENMFIYMQSLLSGRYVSNRKSGISKAVEELKGRIAVEKPDGKVLRYSSPAEFLKAVLKSGELKMGDIERIEGDTARNFRIVLGQGVAGGFKGMSGEIAYTDAVLLEADRLVDVVTGDFQGRSPLERLGENEMRGHLRGAAVDLSRDADRGYLVEDNACRATQRFIFNVGGDYLMVTMPGSGTGDGAQMVFVRGDIDELVKSHRYCLDFEQARSGGVIDLEHRNVAQYRSNLPQIEGVEQERKRRNRE